MEKQLPKNWVESNLFDIANVITGKKDANHSTEDGEFTFFTCAFEPLLSPDYDFDDEVLILPGNGANVGHVFYFKGKFQAYQRTYIIENIKINPKYLYYHLLSFWRVRNENEQYGTATNYIKIGNFKSYSVDIAPLSEQNRIVTKLDALFAQLETIKTSMAKVPLLLKDFRQQVLTQAVTGKLLNVNQFTDLGNLDIEIKTGPFGSALHKSDYIENGIPVINPSHIINGKIVPDFNVTIDEVKFSELKSWKLIDKDIVLGRRGEMGRAAIYKEKNGENLCGTGSLILRCGKKTYPEFLVYYLRSPYCVEFLNNNSVGSTMINLNQKIIKSLKVPNINYSEQQEIVSRVESLFAKADAIEKQYETLKAKIERLPQAILHKAFKGELTEQLDSDGDARELLREIEGLKEAGKTLKSKKTKSVAKKVKSYVEKDEVLGMVAED